MQHYHNNKICFFVTFYDFFVFFIAIVYALKMINIIITL